jgi:hypothetical protein
MLRLLSVKRTRVAALLLLRRLAAQPGGHCDGAYGRTYTYATKTLTAVENGPVRRLATWAYDNANANLGLGWRHRYTRAAQWLVRQRKEHWLQMPYRRKCSRCHHRAADVGKKQCSGCRAAKRAA